MSTAERVTLAYLAKQGSLTRIIVERVLDQRPVDSHVSALLDELYEEYEDRTDEPVPTFGNERENEDWLKKNLDILSGQDVEKWLQSQYVKLYRRLSGVDQRTALETFDFPDLPRQVPKDVLDEIAVTMARLDARDREALRDLALKQRG